MLAKQIVDDLVAELAPEMWRPSCDEAVKLAVAQIEVAVEAAAKAGMAAERMRVIRLLDSAVKELFISPEFAITFLTDLNKHKIL